MRKDWIEVWSSFGLRIFSFADVGLVPRSPDDEIWQLCQRSDLILLTANRNSIGADSLNATIAREQTDDSLPVMTIADAERVLEDRDYAERVAIRLMEKFMDIETLRGTGRLYVP
jgi:hypothetical protein